jgi:hypothetical protein
MGRGPPPALNIIGVRLGLPLTFVLNWCGSNGLVKKGSVLGWHLDGPVTFGSSAGRWIEMGKYRLEAEEAYFPRPSNQDHYDVVPQHLYDDFFFENSIIKIKIPKRWSGLKILPKYHSVTFWLAVRFVFILFNIPAQQRTWT